MLVHYYGHIGQGSGYAIAAERTCRALIAAGVDLEIIPFEDVKPPDDLASQCRKAGSILPVRPDVAIVHTLPLDVNKVHDRVVPVPRRIITYTVWEVFTCPTKIARDLVNGCDSLWVPSKETRRAITSALADGNSGLYRRVKVVPHACDEQPVDIKVHDGVDRPYRFYYIGAWTSRKNPTGLLRAYVNAFDKNDFVELRMHVYGASDSAIAAAIGHMGIQQSELPKMSFSTQRLTDEQVTNIHRWGDCYVTASRGEGWNLPCFEAMRHGNMIITPGQLGSDDYLWTVPECPPTTARIVMNLPQPAMLDVAQMTDAGGKLAVRVIGAQGVTVQQCWLEPDLLDLGRQMREAAAAHDLLTLNYDPVGRFGYAAVGKLLAAEINSL